MASTFSQWKTKAETTLTDLENGFHLVDTDEDKRKLIFANQYVSFYIECPDTEDGNNWNLWSENDRVIYAIRNIIEFVQCSKRKFLPDLIERTCKAVASLENEEMDTEDDEDDEDQDDGDMDNALDYYETEDCDAIKDDGGPAPVEEEDEESENWIAKYSLGKPSSMAVHRLVKDMKSLKRSDGAFGVVGEPQGDNLFLWDVKLTNFDKDTRFGKDIQQYAKQYKREPVVYMQLQFQPDYPMSPPFARVIRPRFQFLTGHITVGGSVCLEMLTKSGWRPTNDIESILVQIRSEVISDPNVRLDPNPDREYTMKDAKDAFLRTVKKYGWDD